jgi:hypothetical protein
MITLPPLSWFIQKNGKTVSTNIYTGSLGTDPSKGCLYIASFNYKVYVQPENTDKPACLYAEYNVRKSLNDGGQIVLGEKEAFPVHTEGLKTASEWLAAKYIAQTRK